jgi:hypothetical protein
MAARGGNTVVTRAQYGAIPNTRFRRCAQRGQAAGQGPVPEALAYPLVVVLPVFSGGFARFAWPCKTFPAGNEMAVKNAKPPRKFRNGSLPQYIPLFENIVSVYKVFL